MTAPCKECPDRTAECHATCERYAAYAKEREQERRNRHKADEVSTVGARRSYRKWVEYQKQLKGR